jgi:hypothetical protein
MPGTSDAECVLAGSVNKAEGVITIHSCCLVNMPRHAAQLGSTHTTSMLLSATPARPPAAEPVRASASGGVLCANKPVAMPAERVPPACTTHHTAGAFNIPCREERGASRRTTPQLTMPSRQGQPKASWVYSGHRPVCKECPSRARARVPVASSAAAATPILFIRVHEATGWSTAQPPTGYTNDCTVQMHKLATLAPKSPEFSDRDFGCQLLLLLQGAQLRTAAGT